MYTHTAASEISNGKVTTEDEKNVCKLVIAVTHSSKPEQTSR